MPVIVLLAVSSLQAAAAILALRTPASPKTRNVIRIAAAMLALMSVRTLLRSTGVWTGPDSPALPWPGAMLELAIPSLALATVLALRHREKNAGSGRSAPPDSESGRHEGEDELRRSRLRLHEAQRVAGLVTFETDLVTGTIWVSDDPRDETRCEGGGNVLTLAEAFEYIVEEDRERVIRAMADSTATGCAGELAVEYRQRIPARGGESIVRTTARVQCDEHCNPIRMIGATLDITAMREAEREIRSLNAELEERVRERTRDLKRAIEELEAFTYSVSHDLRSPLRAMAGYSQMVLDEDGENLSQASRDELARIRASSVRMAGLIDGLLSLSRLTRRKRHDVTVDLTAIAQEVVAELRRLEPSREVEVRIEEGLTAVADPAMMSLVLQHLLSNAWKFTRRTGDARIEFRCEDGDVFCVHDNGAGFDPSQAAKMFRPFQRQHHSDEFEGTGIGLATVGRIVRHYGGRVWADGAIGKGSTFRFTLKRDADEAARTAA